MKANASNKRETTNQHFMNVNQSMNDNVFQRSSLNTIHGDKYNDLARS